MYIVYIDQGNFFFINILSLFYIERQGVSIKGKFHNQYILSNLKNYL